MDDLCDKLVQAGKDHPSVQGPRAFTGICEPSGPLNLGLWAMQASPPEQIENNPFKDLEEHIQEAFNIFAAVIAIEREGDQRPAWENLFEVRGSFDADLRARFPISAAKAKTNRKCVGRFFAMAIFI